MFRGVNSSAKSHPIVRIYEGLLVLSPAGGHCLDGFHFGAVTTDEAALNTGVVFVVTEEVPLATSSDSGMFK